MAVDPAIGHRTGTAGLFRRPIKGNGKGIIILWGAGYRKHNLKSIRSFSNQRALLKKALRRVFLPQSFCCFDYIERSFSRVVHSRSPRIQMSPPFRRLALKDHHLSPKKKDGSGAPGRQSLQRVKPDQIAPANLPGRPDLYPAKQ